MITDKIVYENMDLGSTVRINSEDFNIDSRKLKKALNYYCDLRCKLSKDKFSDMYALMDCIDEAIDQSPLTEKQRERLVLWMAGMTEKEIARTLSLSQVSVHNSLVQSINVLASNLQEVSKKWF